MKKEILSLMFLLAISIAFSEYIFFENNNADSELTSTTNYRPNLIEVDGKTDKNNKEITAISFDIIRISAHGDAVFAGKSQPNVEISLFANEKKISSFFSDPNGEWVWISDSPLSKDFKVFKIKYKDNNGNEFNSTQEIYVLDEKSSNNKPMVLKIDSNDFDKVDIYNRDYFDNGLTLDILNYYPKSKLFFSGRAPPGNKIKIVTNNSVLGTVKSNSNGYWKFSSKELIYVDNSKLEFLTKIEGEELKLETFLDFKSFKISLLKDNILSVNKEGKFWHLSRKISEGRYLLSKIYTDNLKLLNNQQSKTTNKTFSFVNSK